MYTVDEKSRHRPFWIQNKPSSDAYREGWERIFGKKKREQERVISGAITDSAVTSPPSGHEPGQ